nr:MAG TPA: hypothetical protein [Caudoviricetes sp.]
MLSTIVSFCNSIFPPNLPFIFFLQNSIIFFSTSSIYFYTYIS